MKPQLQKFKLYFENLPKPKVREVVPPLRQDLLIGGRWLFSRTNQTRKSLVAFYKDKKPRHLKIEIHLTWTKVFVLFFAGAALWPHAGHSVAESPPKPVTVKIPAKVPQIAQTTAQPQAEATPVTPPAPQPTNTPNIPPGVSGCGVYFSGDPDLDWIITRESGGNSCAVNPSSGACGVAQELPCGKSGCSLGDGNCEIAWMRNYCVARYGSIPLARAYWAAHGNY